MEKLPTYVCLKFHLTLCGYIHYLMKYKTNKAKVEVLVTFCYKHEEFSDTQHHVAWNVRSFFISLVKNV